VTRRLGRLLTALLSVAMAVSAAGCQSPANPTASSSLTPPDHPLAALYRVRAGGDAPDEGRAWLNAADPVRAVEAWAGSASLDAAGIPLLTTIAGEALNAGEIALAREALIALVTRDPSDQASQLALGLLLAAAGLDGAAPALQAASANPALAPQAQAILDATMAESPERLGWAFFAGRLWPYAELAFTRAASVDNFSAAGMAALAVSREFQGKDSDPWMERALSAGPNDAGVRALEAVHLRLAGDFPGSLSAAQRAAALAPESSAMLAQLGAAYERLGELDDARTWYDRAQALANGDPRYDELAAAAAQSEDAALAALLEALERGDASAP